MRSGRYLTLFLFFVLSINGHYLQAHKNHSKKANTPPKNEMVTISQIQSKPVSVTESLGLSSGINQEEHNHTDEEEESLPPLKDLLFEHLHNKIIHFPLAFGLAAVLFTFLSLKWETYEPATRVLFLLAGVTGIIAYFTGDAQAEPFEESYMREWVELHERLGITSTILLWASFFMSINPKLKRYLWVAALAVFVLLSLTGFYGGVLAHAG